MNLNQMLNYLTTIFNNAGQQSGFSEIPFHSINLMVATVYNANINISFPGYKSTQNHCDYLVQLVKNGNYYNISHQDIMEDIYSFVLLNPGVNGPLMENILSDISNNWENININNNYNSISLSNFTLEEFVECICFIAAQEEINYPRSRGFDGYKRPFYSYLEAIYAANGSGIVTFENAISRCNSNRRFTGLSNIPYNLI